MASGKRPLNESAEELIGLPAEVSDTDPGQGSDISTDGSATVSDVYADLIPLISPNTLTALRTAYPNGVLAYEVTSDRVNVTTLNYSNDSIFFS